MPIPASINDLSTTAASNSPPGSEAPITFDDYLRVYASYIASIRDVCLSGTGSVSTLNITYTGTLTGGAGVVNIGSGQIYKDASGNVGFGTTAPSVIANYTSVSLRGASGSFVDVGTTGGGNMGRMGWNGSTGFMEINSLNANSISFLTNSVERMRLDSSGNLKIVNTSSAPATPTGGGVLYVQAGSLKYIGSSGTITTLAAA